MKIILLLLLAFALNTQSAELKPYFGAVTPIIELEDLNGDFHTLEQYKDHVVLVQFWATYCPPCEQEMPSMNSLQAKLKQAGVKFKILAVNMAEKKSVITEFVNRVKPEFSILLDPTGVNIQRWQVFAAPSNFIIDRNGLIKYTLFGGVEWDSKELLEQITQLYQAGNKSVADTQD